MIAVLCLIVLACPLPPAISQNAVAGIASKHPGDIGIGRDSSVIFAENFEIGSFDELKKRWDDVGNKDGKVVAFSSDHPKADRGSRSLQMTAISGENQGGGLYTRLSKPLDQVYARFYVKFEKDADYIHHFVHLGGYNPPTPWAQGGAGTRPNGDERITVGIEPHGDYGRIPAPGQWSFYAYWQDMKISADGKFWGNAMRPEQPAIVPKDRWQCVEIMLTLNSAPEKADGELALWLDGKETMHIQKGSAIDNWSGMGFNLKKDGKPFEGFRFRKSNNLKINFLWLLHYVTESAARQNNVARPKRENRVWFDDIVVATKYIGPITPQN